jgi:hypothetical protein
MSRFHKIASDGWVRWVADCPDAGPYHLMWSSFNLVRSFGKRDLSIGKPRSRSQRAAFEQSKAAFEALRLVGAGHLDTADDGIPWVKAAADAARAEWRRMGHEFGHYESAAVRYEWAVIQRLERLAVERGLTLPPLAVLDGAGVVS